MEIIIHRGTHQIGGCATEYRTKITRIFIDFGSELDSQNAKPLDIEGVTKGNINCDAVFFTHYHGDHMGHVDIINKDITLYMGKAAKQIATIFNNRTKSYHPDRINGIKTFEAGKTVTVGDIRITPYLVDHSAYDAYMFKIEADGKTVLHTGDFRTHGFRGKGIMPTLKRYVGKVDALVCEGTTLSRTDSKCETENELKSRIKTVLEENKYVFVVCSSTNIDRIAGICSVIPRGKYCICDKYQLSVIEYVREYTGGKSSLYKFEKALYYGDNLDEKMLNRGFCMFVRAGNPEHKRIMEMYKDKNPVVIYSMWQGYLKQDNIKEFLDGYKRLDMHTSGHADINAIKMVVDIVNPEVVIPMHTEAPEIFLGLIGKEKVRILKDHEKIEIGGKKMTKIDPNTFYSNKITYTKFSENLTTINNNLSLFTDTKNYNAELRDSYIVKSHGKPSATDYQQAKNKVRFRKEEWICKLAYGKTFSEIGEIVDYQVPLKVPKGKQNTGKGKIDLLSYNEETDTAYLLEVKVDTSTESPLKAIMECYTYWQQVNGNKPYDFLGKTVIKDRISKKTKLKKAIIIFESNERKYLYQKMQIHYKELKDLMNKLDVECFIAVPDKNDKNIIQDIRR